MAAVSIMARGGSTLSSTDIQDRAYSSISACDHCRFAATIGARCRHTDIATTPTRRRSVGAY
jgi:hypothetical protein